MKESRSEIRFPGKHPDKNDRPSTEVLFKKRLPEWIVVSLFLFFLAGLSYGWMIIQPGLFGDDWPYLWSYHLFGLDGYRQFVEWDRPFSAFVYLIAGSIFGEDVRGYHFCVFLARWLGSVIFWLIIRKEWPQRKRLAFWSACLILVYPGFIQQAHSLEFILHFSVLLMFLLSVYWMLLSLERGRWRIFYLTGGILTAFNFFSLEYFLGLELLRPVLIWLLIRRKNQSIREIIRKTISAWAPYLAVLVSYSFWRIFIFKFPTYQPTFLNDMLTHPGKAILGLVVTIFSNLRAVLPGAWRQVFEVSGRPIIILAASGVLFIAVMVFFRFFIRDGGSLGAPNEADEGENFEPWIVGGLAVIFAGVPYWITGLPVQLEFPWDRSTLSFLFGVSILTASLAEMFRPAYRNLLLAALVSMAVGFHLHNYSLYHAEWEKLRTFFWQISWRMPGLEPGAIFLSENVPLNYYSDNSLTPVVNWMYAPDHNTPAIPYNYLEMGERLGKALPALEPELEVVHGYRFVVFTGSSSNLIPLYFSPPGCVRVLHQTDQKLPGLPSRLARAAGISNAGNLINDGSSHPAVIPKILGPEPHHGWCYYFEKADLAAQLEDWDQVVELAELVETAGLMPADETEWLPFLKAFAASGNHDVTVELIETILRKEGGQEVVCDSLEVAAAWREDNGQDVSDLRQIAQTNGGCGQGEDSHE